MGKIIFEWAPESPAASEIEKLTKEILSYMSKKSFQSVPKPKNAYR